MAIPKTYARGKELTAGSENANRPAEPAKHEHMIRFHFPAGLIAVCIAILFVSGCHRGTVNEITINLDPNTTQSLDAGHSENFTATLAGDTTNKGVRWSITLNGNTCSTGTGSTCGTLSNPTITSVTYTAPNVSAQTNFTLTATSIEDPVIVGNVTIGVDIAPQFAANASTGVPTGAMNGVPYTGTVQAIDGVQPLKFSLASGSLPAGLSLNSLSGGIVGTPTFQGPGSQTYNFSVQVTDFDQVSAAAPLALSITVAGPPPLSATASLPQGFLGGGYSGAISSTGGVPPLTFGLTSGSLPPGLSMGSTNGQITGIPTTNGTYPFAVLITDSAIPTHQTANVSASITVSTPSRL